MGEKRKGKDAIRTGTSENYRLLTMPRPSPPPPGLFRDVLLDPERERIPEAAPLVSYSAEDEETFLREIDRRARDRIHVRRRGINHGDLAQLRPEGLLPPRPRRKRREVQATQRWRAAQPILLPGIHPAAGGLGAAVDRLHGRFEGRSDLADWLTEQGVSTRDESAPLADAERDLARCTVSRFEGGGSGEKNPAADVWVKLGRLSTHPADRSLRLRVGFGREGDDDGSNDESRHHAVAELARPLLPGATALLSSPGLLEAVERVSELKTYATQGIAYWNAPDGGARFHHDAFALGDEDGQRGVLYWQGVGRTLWLALSVEDLGLRLREFLGWMEEGEMPWLRDELVPDAADFAELLRLAAQRDTRLAELALPGCGRFGPIVDRGPEFTSFLADAGHAVLLGPGDVLLLPNHGLDRTAMHSVFHGGGEIAYGLSFALREDLG